MPVDRPTFSESWYRVSNLRPRLRSTVQVHRQHYRGRMWYVLQDPASNQFFRLNEAAYEFVALLDGRRTVADVWKICNERLGDSAPTQGEAIQLLGQLYTTNLLQADLPPDAEGLFHRYRRRVAREVQGILMNLLFIRIPLLDPDRFLDRWVNVLGSVFSVPGLVLWLILVGTGVSFVAGRAAELADQASGILDLANLPLLYVALVITKVFHEFGHAFACKKFGRAAGTGGEVHVMGVMFLVFMPLPYVDASSAWAFRRKWHRVVVGSAGMMVELAVAAVAAVVWASTAQGSVVHAVTYNMMFIAGVSSLLFNGNPLLRFDGYYILSDLLEIPNLAQRGKAYLYYLVRRYVWRVRRAQSPAHTPGERFWLAGHCIASFLYRIGICVAILLFLSSKVPVIGAILAAMAVVAWVFVPLGKLVRYLATHAELERVRGWAVGSTLGVLAAVVAGVGLVPAPDRYRIDGVVEPVHVQAVHARVDGFVREIRVPSGAHVEAGDVLLVAENPELRAERDQLVAERKRLEVRRRLALTEEQGVAKAQMLAEQVAVLDKQIRAKEEKLEKLTLRAPLAGTWIAPDIERYEGAYLRRGDRVGLVADETELFVRAVAGQKMAAVLGDVCRVDLRVRGRPSPELHGEVTKVFPAGEKRLPSAALGYLAGGSVETAVEDKAGLTAAEGFFEVRIALRDAAGLKSGQVVVIRAELPPKPLAVQWRRALLRLFQRRFHT